MKLPFKTPIRIEDGDYLIDADCELILRNWEATQEEMDAIVRCVNMHDPLIAALRECRGAMQSMATQIEQMRGMFDDEDGAIESAIDDYNCASKVSFRVLREMK
jgi:hypothetical protein